MCANWGFERLAEQFKQESIDEMRDADALIERIPYLDGTPNLQRLGTVRVGETVPEKLSLALDLEKAAIQRLNTAVTTTRDVGDNGSRELFERILLGEEHHADWLEAQLFAIDQVGVNNYLAQQLRA